MTTAEIETSQFVEVLISGSQSAHAGELREISAGQILIGQRNQQPTTLKPDGRGTSSSLSGEHGVDRQLQGVPVLRGHRHQALRPRFREDRRLRDPKGW